MILFFEVAFIGWPEGRNVNFPVFLLAIQPGPHLNKRVAVTRRRLNGRMPVDAYRPVLLIK